ncbi:MAG: hypothetical protein E7000_02275 [Coriobacteriaceae bacterium]|nr:hypothetical protein [Coriobacteriaceae bacterium]
MGNDSDKRRWRNLAGGIMLIAAGAAAVALVELAWDASVNAKVGSQAPVQDAGHAGFSMEDFSAYVLDDADLPGISNGVSSAFVAECFDPRSLGEVNCSDDGSVVGIVSDDAAADLFRRCAERLSRRGWVPVGSSRDLRCTFLRNAGTIRWLFLDVSQVAESSVAVMVLEEGL